MKINKEFTCFLVAVQLFVFNFSIASAQCLSEQVEVTTVKAGLDNYSKGIDFKLFKKVSSYEIIVKNNTQEKLNINYNDLKLVLSDKTNLVPFTRKEVFNKCKSHYIIRSVIFGVPIAVFTLGLTVPFVGTSVALGIDTNRRLKSNLNSIYFTNVTLLPSEELHFFVFAPKYVQNIKNILLF